MYMDICVYVYIYIYMYINMYIYIYIHICAFTKIRLTQFDGKGDHLMRTPMHTSCIQDAYPEHAEEVAN